MDSEKNKVKTKYLNVKAATDKCLTDLALIRQKKRTLANVLIKKSDTNKIAKVRNNIQGIK